jgi:hypothetical protein
MAGRQNPLYTVTIILNDTAVTISANTPEELGRNIVAVQQGGQSQEPAPQRPGTAHRPTTSRARPVSDLRPARPSDAYQAPRVPIAEQDCYYRERCNNSSCPRKHPAKATGTSNEEKETETAEKPVGFCKFGVHCKNKNTTCKFNHEKKPCLTFQKDGTCPYGDNCKFAH